MPTLNDALDDFLLEQRIRLNSAKTIKDYTEKITMWTNFVGVDKPLENITIQDMRRYIDSLRARDLARETIRSYITALKVAWAFWSEEYGLEDVMERIKKPKASKPIPKGISSKDFIRIFEATSDDRAGIRDRAILAILADTGSRRGGLVSLTIDSIDTDARRGIVIEKGFKQRTIFWTNYTNRLLRQWVAVRPRCKTDALFVSLREGRKSEALTGEGIYQILKRLKKKAGVTGRANPHAFRHNFARRYLLDKGDGVTLARLLGWADLRMAEKYAIFDEDELAELQNEHSPLLQMLNS